MVTGLGIITLRIEGCRSLKEKRKIVKSMIARIRNAFNVAVAETGANDVLSRAEIGFAVVGNDRREINARVDKIFNMADRLALAEIIDTQMEVISL
ncbi:MAG: DUF503 domain-containing protein [Thermodesulfobacteriota bacterium]|nr:DUF503 domain-containing protein [Thermodesulfobacteriota bacterium]